MNQPPSTDARQGLQLTLDIIGGKDLAERRDIIRTAKNAAANADQHDLPSRRAAI
jgi:hypothetical protein